MSNLLVYLEENLMYSPAKFYEEEKQNITSENNDDAVENSKNIPLVSPQSTLRDNSVKPHSNVMLSADDNLYSVGNDSEEHLIQQMSLSDKTTIMFSPPKTNPFIEDTPVTNSFENDLSPQQFMQLWAKNMELQMQITATFNMILSRAVNNFAKKAVNNPLESENIPNTTNSSIVHVANSTSVPVDCTTTNSPNTHASNFLTNAINCTNTKSTNVNADFKSTGYTSENIIPSANLYQEIFNLTSSSKNGHENIFANEFENTTKNYISPCFNSTTSAQSIFDTSQLFASKDSATVKTSSPEKFQKFNNISDDFTSLDTCFNDEMPLKETNPFRLSLAGKLKITDSSDESDFSDNSPCTTRKNPEDVMKIDVDPMKVEKQMMPDISTMKRIENDMSNNLQTDVLNQQQGSVKNILNNTNNINRPIFNKKSFALNSVWDMHNLTEILDTPPVTHTAGEIWKHGYEEKSNENELQYGNHGCELFLSAPNYFNFNSQQQNGYQSQDINPLSKSYSSSPQGFSVDQKIECFEEKNPFIRDNNFTISTRTPNFKTTLENDMFAPNVSVYKYTPSSGLPINNCIEPSLIDNANIDEGYLTRPPTSYTSSSSSLFWQSSSEAESNENLLSHSINKICNEPTDEWFISFGENFTLPSKSSNRQHFPFEKSMENIEKFEVIDHMKVGNECFDESDLKNIWKPLPSEDFTQIKKNCSSLNSSSKNKALCQAIEISKQVMHIFHFKGEGWLITNEFINTFTMYKTTARFISILTEFNIHVEFEEIDKTQCSVEFYSFNSTLTKVTEDIINSTDNIHLISIKFAIKLLNNLNIVSLEDIKIALINDNNADGSFAHRIMVILKDYKLLKHIIESNNN